ncbi:MAG: chorismate mutase [Chloroflexi bacterium]|nr:chorismate mutase [Chloroflexota bacterium]
MSSTVCRGVRGAINVAENSRDTILDATRELLQAMIDANAILPDDVASAFFTTTMDLTAEYPAVAARQLGWYDVPLLCGHEMDVPHGLAKCIRILVMWNTTLGPRDIKHIYLRDAVTLRPDIHPTA